MSSVVRARSRFGSRTIRISLVDPEISKGTGMSEEIDRHILRRFEICQKLGKGVRLSKRK